MSGQTYIIKAGDLYFTPEREWSLHQERAWRIQDIGSYYAEQRADGILYSILHFGDRYGEQVHGTRIVRLVRKQ